MNKLTNAELAVTLLRITLGVNFFSHGLSRMGENYSKFAGSVEAQFSQTILPSFLVSLTAHAIPLVEITAGIFLLLGLFTRYAATAVMILLCVLIFGMGQLEKWEIVGTQMIYIPSVFLLIFHLEHNRLKITRD